MRHGFAENSCKRRDKKGKKHKLENVLDNFNSLGDLNLLGDLYHLALWVILRSPTF
jgi:hypothetical protein